MPSLVHSKDKQPLKSDSVESHETSRPSSAEDVVEAEGSAHHDEEKGIEVAQTTEKPFDARSTKTTESVIPPPPDGGLHAWLKVFGGFMIYVHIIMACEWTASDMFRSISGASRSATGPFKLTTSPTSSPQHLPRRYRGSAPCKPGCSSSSASCLVRCSTWATSASCSLRATSWSCSVL